MRGKLCTHFSVDLCTHTRGNPQLNVVYIKQDWTEKDCSFIDENLVKQEVTSDMKTYRFNAPSVNVIIFMNIMIIIFMSLMLKGSCS